MPLQVEQLSLGPLGTNCYVVRADAASPDAAVVDPSGDAAELRLLLAQLGARCAGILITHGHWDHLVGVADLAEATGAPVYMPEGERVLLESPERFTPGALGRALCLRIGLPSRNVVGIELVTLGVLPDVLVSKLLGTAPSLLAAGHARDYAQLAQAIPPPRTTVWTTGPPRW